MTVQFNPNENMHDQFHYHNSAKAIARFPFPFPEDQYMYSVNIEPVVSRPDSIFEHWFDVDEQYVTDMFNPGKGSETLHYHASHASSKLGLFGNGDAALCGRLP